MKDQAKLVRKALALFNCWSMKHKNNKHIGELRIGDFVELVEFLEQLEMENE